MAQPVDKNKTLQDIRSGKIKLERENQYWTQDEIEKAKSMYLDGCDMSDIALELKRTEFAITQKLQMEGVVKQMDGSRNRIRRRVIKAPVCLCSVCMVSDCLGPACQHYAKTEEDERC